MNGKNIRQILGRAVLTGGLITGGVSFIDGLVASATSKEFGAQTQTLQELEGKYGVTRECTADSSSGLPIDFCKDYVQGDHTEAEKDQIVAQFDAELNQRIDEIPIDQDARARGLRDDVGFFGGIGLAALGSGIKNQGKERE